MSATTADPRARETPPTGAGAPTAGEDRPWRRALGSAALVWTASHLAYAVATLLSWRAGRQPPPAPDRVLSGWLSWDTGHYLRIADQGYGVVDLDAAFFPLYPMLIRACDVLLPGGSLLAGLAVSSAACFGALAVLHRLTAHEFGDPVAERTIWYFIAFPTAFFLTAAYNAALFILLVAGAMYAMRRGHWWLAGLLGALAGATRATGVLLVVPLLYEYLRQRGFRPRAVRPDVAWLGLVPTGLLAFAAYCWYALGDPLAFSHAQRHWYREVSWPWMALWRTFEEATRAAPLSEFAVVNTIDLAAACSFLLLLALCVVGPWRVRPDQGYLVIFGVLVVMVPLLVPATDNRPLISMARHVLEAIPVFMVLGRIGANRLFDRIYPMPAIAAQTLLLVVFLHYDWAG